MIYKNTEIEKKLNRWLKKADLDEALRAELQKLVGEPVPTHTDDTAAQTKELEDRFYKDLEFGTGGLRGLLGAGTNRLNIYTVRKATQGIADYMKANGLKRAVAVSYDSRINSQLFAENTAGVMLANGIDVFLFDELMPAPALSFATRYHGCSIGIMITASHNPKEYNGYKVYNGRGCQVTLEQAADILNCIEQIDIFDDVKFADISEFDGDKKNKEIHAGYTINCQSQINDMTTLASSAVDDTATMTWMGNDTKEAYLQAVMSQSVGIPKGELADLKIAYTPLNGAGNKPVREMLRRLGVKTENIHVVAEQENPDGNFPTCPYPNPEKKEALEKGIALCESTKSDILIATDPDSDRLGLAVRIDDNQVKILTGNEVGLLMLDFVCSMRQQQVELQQSESTTQQNPVVVRTMVTSRMTDAIAANYGIKVKTTLTGFKFIGELIGELEDEGREADFVFGFEESCGYLSGTYVRDKDGVNAALLACEMTAHYKARGITLAQRMEQLYQQYGYCQNSLLEFTLKGADGMKKMSEIMASFRNDPPAEVIGSKVISKADYMKQEIYIKGDCTRCDLVAGTKPTGLPKSDVMEFGLANGTTFTVRPSGTEPKLKIYIFAQSKSKAETQEVIDKLKQELIARVESI